jgi:signal transduction histidine kinase
MTSANTDSPITRFWQKISLVAEISSVCRRLDADRPDFHEVLSLVQQIIPFDAATLMLWNQAGGTFETSDQLGAPVPLPSPISRTAARSSDDSRPRSREPMIFSVGSQPDPFEDGNEFEDIMVVPLLLDSRIIGFLNLGAYHTGILEDKHLKLMSIVADQMAISIERLGRMAEIVAQNRSLEQSHRRLRDQQERIIANEKLLAVTQLAASINHQINNPLSVIVGQVQLLLWDDSALDPKLKERLCRVERAAIRIGEVSRGLLRIDETLSEAGLSASLTEERTRTGK